ncbi:MAG: hypothetical protein A2Z19_03075 [Deltaproteobacteria bacterium RBG_16_54_18]|nr:MAG: hypothetical protein A2Z19_03075 [Deltaproteobacteria bacterium RBG_16_54_18]
MRKVAIVVILCVALLAPTAFAGTETIGYVYDLDLSLPDYVNAAWLGYLMQRQIYIGEHMDLYKFAPGIIIPTFAEEVEGRKALAQIWKELKEADRTRTDKYLNELIPVHEADFMREYVWKYLKQQSWATEPENLKLKEFSAWRQKHLQGHQAETRGKLSFAKRSNEATSPGR